MYQRLPCVPYATILLLQGVALLPTCRIKIKICTDVFISINTVKEEEYQ